MATSRKIGGNLLDPLLTPSLYLGSRPSLFMITLDGLGIFVRDAVRPPSQNILARHVYLIYPPFCQLMTPSLAPCDAVKGNFQHAFETLSFSALFRSKTSKMLPFVKFLSKVPKMTKGTI
jgi:hypothetical protein